jgi:bifunctional DNA-binding transcriptional regulator/antitoxin component of YhaV-PrlF toxin-antitoxin module
MKRFGLGAAENRGLALASRHAAMQHCNMSTTIPLTKRGSLTLPPSLRRKMGLDKLRNPMVVVEERDGGLFLQPAVAMPVRDLPKGTIEQWIARDEADMAAFRATPRKAKR